MVFRNLNTSSNNNTMTSFKSKQQSKRRKGFTLIELSIIVAIIAIIGYFAGPKLIALIKGSQTTTQQANVTALNDWLSIAENGGVTYGATASVGTNGGTPVGTQNTPGVLPNGTGNAAAATLITAMQAGVVTYNSGDSKLDYADFRGTPASYDVIASGNNRRFTIHAGATNP